METPKLNMKPILWSGIGALIAMLCLSAYAWPKIPAGTLIPVHWGADGQPNGYGSKLEGLFMMPIIYAVLFVFFLILPKIEPRKVNFANSFKAYNVIILALIGVMLVIHTATVLIALGVHLDINKIVVVTIGILFIMIGNVMGKIRSNFFMGIRTPWTLSSELSWRKTHRLGGWLFVMVGVAMLFSVFFHWHELVCNCYCRWSHPHYSGLIRIFVYYLEK